MRAELARKIIISFPYLQGTAWLSQREPEFRTGDSGGDFQALGLSTYSYTQPFLLKSFLCLQCQGWGLTHPPGDRKTASQGLKGLSKAIQSPTKQAPRLSLSCGWEAGEGRYPVQEPHFMSPPSAVFSAKLRFKKRVLQPVSKRIVYATMLGTAGTWSRPQP